MYFLGSHPQKKGESNIVEGDLSGPVTKRKKQLNTKNRVMSTLKIVRIQDKFDWDAQIYFRETKQSTDVEHPFM